MLRKAHVSSLTISVVKHDEVFAVGHLVTSSDNLQGTVEEVAR